ncbi:MAG: hypothetical protein A2499_09595 [Stygiobacter sp. RIFOXYC12_FULL_38_8]|nr:MAG: hypothetical protein A2X62_11330 [Stygiobacter sp. GWC2_38_9]OGV08902.1 MAG: hypothetical protein A2299_18985 [Stygiobacter sp. RIFOXYB2_FULL_37_11]OGV15568.1 MAG: hypothetical protein A2440_00745 [Stygiobacter sp. RIFOXYC2_FULL_38_25]OGV16465.1 MAG: hypothetical protein A2237_11260 [Stygiobacter sp. RIFOXYA2_FULL_38_8]OGV26039.1 MAG: hypothetical protein A2499_09595 [Stygiobacter sp. RIFOXYC12_FULL_38_8]OGV80683.1 MAG: hypothetical protein A2X65_05795 [Stygiobacter sp. GWF2_38_21]
MTRINIICTLLLFCFNVSNAQWTNNQNASQVVGQPDFTTYNSGSALSQLNWPTDIVLDVVRGKAYVADYTNNRVLRYAYPFSGSPITAEMQFGTGASVTSQNSFKEPLSVAVYNDVLYILDNVNRILRFDNASTKTNQPNADGVIGQTDFTSGTTGLSSTKFDMPQFIYIDENGNLWVPDAGNNRVLKFSDVNSKLTDGTAAADFVLGQTNYTTKASGTSTSSMNGPNGVCVKGTTVWVSDTWNHRVLRFDNPLTNGVAANGMLGITSQWGPTQNAFEMSSDLEIDGNGNLYVADYNRVLIFLDAAAKADGSNADNILGQSSWTTDAAGGGANGFNVNWSEGLAIDNANKKLFVADIWNNRVLEFTASSALPVELISFTGSANGSSVTLNWQTATEVNNYGFNVERALMVRQNSPQAQLGMTWEKIAFVQGHGNSNSPKEYSFTENLALAHNLNLNRVQYRLKQIDFNGVFEYSPIVEVNVEAPSQLKLAQNYPNPFNPETTINFQIPFASHVTLKIYDVLGREVASLVDEFKQAGTYVKTLHATSLPSGVYFYKLQTANGFSETKKLILLK